MENGLKCEGEFVNLLRERNNGSHRRAIAKFFEVYKVCQPECGDYSKE